VAFPPDFEFSQGSLQDYTDCHRRFQLRYLLEQPWPAIEAEPALEHEKYNIQGQRFHRLLERNYLGVPHNLLKVEASEEPLHRWWQAFLDEPPLNLPTGRLLPEARLVARVGGRRLVAVFDLLAIDPGRRMVIVDWKTGRSRPSRETIESHLQTHVYPFVAVEAGAHLFGGPVDPARVTMIYWFANYPDHPHVFYYDAGQHHTNSAYLASLVDQIEQDSKVKDTVWELTADVRRCRFCVYRSLCGRGVEAKKGDPDDFAVGDLDTDVFDLSEVDEIAY